MAHTKRDDGRRSAVPVTMNAIREQWAIWWRYRSWHGIQKGTWCGLFAGRSVVSATQTQPPFWRINYPGRQVLFSGYHLSRENLPSYVGNSGAADRLVARISVAPCAGRHVPSRLRRRSRI